MPTPYPRDLVGFGRNPPKADWPGQDAQRNSRIAVQFVINYEEGGERSILHGDATSEAFLSEIPGAEAWPGQRHMNMESIYEYGARAGFWRLWRLFTARNMPVTVFGVASAMARNSEAVAAMTEAGWEIASHGLKWIDYRNVPARDEAADIAQAVELHGQLVGARPLGFYQGRTSEHTLDIAMREQGFLYLADSYADDLPYWHAGPHGPQLIVPYTLDANDMRCAPGAGFTNGEQFFSYLKDAFDLLYMEGAQAAKMLSVGLHCRLAGRPGRAAALARFLDYVQGFPDVFVARRLDIARHWVARHPPQGGYRPSHMPRALFVEVFGGIYEHSPHIAEAAHRVGLTSGQDDADGLAQAMAQAAASMGATAQLALINAHPDLAGRLVLASGLTPDSASEQGGAGLDRLTAEEHTQFTELNAAYRARFGFPFIMAVKGFGKQAILETFQARLQHGREQELATALAQVDAIALLRLRGKLRA